MKPQFKSYFKKKRQEKAILEKFRSNKKHLRFIERNLEAGSMRVEKRMNFSSDEPALLVVVGESGIGKTTEICKYVEEIRKTGHPALYVNMSLNKTYNFAQFLDETFGTSDSSLILNTIEKKFTKKGIVPTFIIDNIHYARVDDKIDTALLTFLNGEFYQGLKMSVIMVASINEAAYEIQSCIFFSIGFSLITIF